MTTPEEFSRDLARGRAESERWKRAADERDAARERRWKEEDEAFEQKEREREAAADAEHRR